MARYWVWLIAKHSNREMESLCRTRELLRKINKIKWQFFKKILRYLSSKQLYWICLNPSILNNLLIIKLWYNNQMKQLTLENHLRYLINWISFNQKQLILSSLIVSYLLILLCFKVCKILIFLVQKIILEQLIKFKIKVAIMLY